MTSWLKRKLTGESNPHKSQTPPVPYIENKSRKRDRKNLLKAVSQNPWQKFIDEKRETIKEQQKLDAIHESFENKYLANYIHEPPPMGLEF